MKLAYLSRFCLQVSHLYIDRDSRVPLCLLRMNGWGEGGGRYWDEWDERVGGGVSSTNVYYLFFAWADPVSIFHEC
jgi:hypothetical protein